MSDTNERVRKIIVEHLGVEPERVVPEARLVPPDGERSGDDDLGADSLDVVELVMAFEEEFEIQIEDGTESNLRTVRDCTDLIDKLVAQPAG